MGRYLHTYSTYVDISVPVPAEKRLPVRNRELVPVPNFPVPVPDFFAGFNLYKTHGVLAKRIVFWQNTMCIRNTSHKSVFEHTFSVTNTQK